MTSERLFIFQSLLLEIATHFTTLDKIESSWENEELFNRMQTGQDLTFAGAMIMALGTKCKLDPALILGGLIGATGYILTLPTSDESKTIALVSKAFKNLRSPNS